MLYIFHVDTGATLTFDIKLALTSVAELMEAIETRCGVLKEDQVLLMSGGECLEPTMRVCSYSAGTDTSPIYLFSKASIESQIPPVPHTDYSCDIDLVDQINASLNMPAAYATVVARAHLAQQCCTLAREQVRTCEQLVHDQHLQQQGWSAVIANLDDITRNFRDKAIAFEESFSCYLTERDGFMELLDTFSADLETLAKIPILPALRAQAESLYFPDDEPSIGDQIAQYTGGDDSDLDLYTWISAKDNHSSLEFVSAQCSRGLENFNDKLMEGIMKEVNTVLKAATSIEMKDIKGLGERLFALEGLMTQAKQLVREQGELAQGFHQNQTRASNLGDPSILPDLCVSHRRQLVVMMENHGQLRDIRRRCVKAKEELSFNIYQRLKWITFVENKLLDLDKKLVMYNESLKRLKKYLEVVHQVHRTPQMYMSAVAEVVRRRTFSEAFLLWASNLACQLMSVHNEEVERRREFQENFAGHFLNSLFPGLEDSPPAFATQAPTMFDNYLPKLTTADMESLKSQLPELAGSLTTPDLNSITQFFLSKSLTDVSRESKQEKETPMPVDEVPPTKLEICDRGRAGFGESETDTEDYEKIPEGPTDTKLNSYHDEAKQIGKDLEENLGNTRSEVERLRSIMRTMKLAANEAMNSLRSEFVIIRQNLNEDAIQVGNMAEQAGYALMQHRLKYEEVVREREAMTVEHEQEMSDIRKVLQNRDNELRNMYGAVRKAETELADRSYVINTMRAEVDGEHEAMRGLLTQMQKQLDEALERARVEKEEALKEANDKRVAEVAEMSNSLGECQRKVKELEEALAAARNEQQRAVKEVTDKLQMEYKSELDTIRTRFKMLATVNSTMERSPSNSSLEKIERPDVIDRATHEAILARTREEMEAEKAEALQRAVERETANFEMMHGIRVCLAMKDLTEQLEAHRFRENSLLEECQKYQEIIRRQSEEDGNTHKNLQEKVDVLEAERNELESTVVSERQLLKQREQQITELEEEWSVLRNKLTEKTSESGPSLEETLQDLLSGGQVYCPSVSDAKKLRLDMTTAAVDSVTRRLEALEADNKRLNAELRELRVTKENLEAKVDTLQADKVRLEVKLIKERSSRVSPSTSGLAASCSALTTDSRDKEMIASVAVVSESENASSSESAGRVDVVSHYRDLMAKKPGTFPLQELRVTVTTCNPGDTVFVVWDTARNHYTVIQDSRTIYILNSECIESLGLHINPDGTPKVKHIVGEVVDKQYCQAKKPENRYHVPQGCKFYRVRVKPRAYNP